MVKTRLTRVAGLAMVLGSVSGILMADPLPSGILGAGGTLLNTSVNMQSLPYPVSFQFSTTYGNFTGSGGGFAAKVDGFNTIVWCVDSEEDISLPTNYQADLVQLSTVAANSSDVRYGNVTGSAWNLNLGAAPYDTAAFRYEAAAYLVSQYQGFPNGPSSSDLVNQELQTAAWELLYNSSVTAGYGITFSQIQTGGSTFNGSPAALAQFQSAVSADVADAVACVLNGSTCPGFHPGNWAVLSGPVNPSGALGVDRGNQTYLVQLAPVPEPSSLVLFGGVLLVCGFLLHRGVRAKSPAA